MGEKNLDLAAEKLIDLLVRVKDFKTAMALAEAIDCNQQIPKVFEGWIIALIATDQEPK